MQRRVLTTLGALAAALALASCGSESVQTNIDNGPLKGEKDQAVLRGANLFADRCSGCHTLAVAGTQGGAYSIKDRERTDGPNFDLRAETKGSVLYALHNGGFSGAIMPANIAVGSDADAVAAFLCKYTGLKAGRTSSPQKQQTPAERCAENGPPRAGDTPAGTGTPSVGAASETSGG
jgi:mono/diheme cytochrome c family protein